MLFIKPNGTELEVNDNSAAHALALGWKPKGLNEPAAEAADEPDPAPKKRGRPFKA